MRKNRKYSFNLILIIIFIITGVTLSFGYDYYLIAIPTPVFHITESFAIMLYLLFVSFIITKRKIIFYKGVLKFYFIFLLLLLLIAIINIIFSEVTIREFIKKLTPIYTIFLLFPLMYLVNTRQQVLILINALYLIALISSIVYIFQYSTGIELEASSGAIYNGIYRINHPGLGIIALVFLITVAHFLVYGYKIKYIAYYIVALISLLVIVLTLARGFIGAVIISSFFMYYKSFSQAKSSYILRGFSFVFVIGLFFTVYALQNPKIIDSFTNRMEEGVNDVSDNSGSYNTRTEMMSIKMGYIAENAPLFGIGFAYHTAQNKEEALSRKYYNNPITINGDSTYQNIVIVSGFLGLLLWLINLLFIAKKASIIFNKSKDNFIKFLALFSGASSLFIIVHGFSSSYFSSSGFAFLSLVIAFLFYADSLYKNEKINNSKTESRRK